MGTRGGCRLEIRDHDHAELVRLDLAATEGARARRQPAARIEARLRAAGGAWRAGPRHPVWWAAPRLLPSERGRFGFASPVSYLQRRVDRQAQVQWRQPQGHAAVLAQMAAAVRGGSAPLATGDDARAALALIQVLESSARDGGGRVMLPVAGPGA